MMLVTVVGIGHDSRAAVGTRKAIPFGSAAMLMENSCVLNGIDQHDSNRAFVMTCT